MQWDDLGPVQSNASSRKQDAVTSRKSWRINAPRAHPAVVCVVLGARNASELLGIVRWMRHPIPPALWQAVRAQGLLQADAPVPGGA